MTYRLICMTFDGDHVREGEFDTVEQAWDRASDMGSRWYFYPWCFVTTESGKTIVAAPDGMKQFTRKRLATVKTVFKALSADRDMENADVDTFTLALMGVQL